MSRVYSCIKCFAWWCIYVHVFTNKISVLFCSVTNVFFYVKNKSDCNLAHYGCLDNQLPKRTIVDIVKQLTSNYVSEWKTALCRVESVSGRGRNKLRTYTTFKEEFTVEQYCCMILSPLHRATFCKFRCGVAPILIETGRYEHLSVDERKCPFCNTVEDEGHVLFNCHLYEDIGLELIEKAMILESNYTNLSDLKKLELIFTKSMVFLLLVLLQLLYTLLYRLATTSYVYFWMYDLRSCNIEFPLLIHFYMYNNVICYELCANIWMTFVTQVWVAMYMLMCCFSMLWI